MPLLDPKGNKPGTHWEPGNFTATYTRGDTGEKFYGLEYDMRYTRSRASNTASPVRTIPGTNTLWRDPTSFSRDIYWHFPQECSENYIFPGRVDTLETVSGRFLGNNPKLMEFLPMYPVGGYRNPQYDYNDRARAVTECLGKIADGKANLSESLATYRQTADMLWDTSSGLLKALLAVKRGQFSAVPSHLGLNTPKGAAGKLLEWRYGWKPLAGEVFAIADLLGNMIPENRLITARRTVRGSLQYESSAVYTGQHNRFVEWSTKSDYSTTCQLTGLASESWLRSANQFGLVNPMQLAWELVPWSFVVDWFMPIGNVLSALTASAGLDFVGGYTSCRIHGKKDIKIGQTNHPAVQGGPTSYRTERSGFTRSRLFGWPLPLPYVKSPFSNEHSQNALALLLQLRK